MSSLRKRLDAFPTQLILTVVWGVPVSILAMVTDIGLTIRFVTFISLYAIVVSHFTAHLAWKAKRAAESAK